jgi:hypothetical protein
VTANLQLRRIAPDSHSLPENRAGRLALGNPPDGLLSSANRGLLLPRRRKTAAQLANPSRKCAMPGRCVGDPHHQRGNVTALLTRSRLNQPHWQPNRTVSGCFERTTRAQRANHSRKCALPAGVGGTRPWDRRSSASAARTRAYPIATAPSPYGARTGRTVPCAGTLASSIAPASARRARARSLRAG